MAPTKDQTSPLATALRTAITSPQRPARMLCSVCALLRDLPPADAQALADALRSDVSAGILERILSEAGTRVAENQLNRHRRGQCATGAIYGGVR